MYLNRLNSSTKIFVRNLQPYSTAQILDENLYDNLYTDTQVTTKPYSAVPGPKSLPVFGNSWRFAPLIGQYRIDQLDKVMWSLHRQYGNVVKVGGLVGHPDLLFVFDAGDIERVFRREERMPHRPSMPSLHYYKQQLRGEFFQGNVGVIGVHGEKWEEFRRKVQQVLLPPKFARKYANALDEIAEDFLTRISTQLLDGNDETPENFLNEIYKWALESVARVSLDRRLGCLDPNLHPESEPKRIIDSINTFFWNVAEVELKMPIWRVYKNKAFRDYIGALEDFRMLCMKYIDQTLEQMKTKNYDKTPDGNVSIVERILTKTGNPKLAAVLALDLLLVGVDTTSIAAASTIYQLTQNPDKQEILYEELQRALLDDTVYESVEDKTPYLRACIKETLRLYPVIIGNGRSLQTDMIISGYHIPKGTHVIFPHLVASHNANYFESPEKFIPERWLKTEQECPVNRTNMHSFASLPFGYGRRSCLGRRFAELELQILLSKIFRKYRVEYHHEPFTYKITPTYVPEQPLKFKLIERSA